MAIDEITMNFWVKSPFPPWFGHSRGASSHLAASPQELSLLLDAGLRQLAVPQGGGDVHGISKKFMVISMVISP